MRIRSYPARRSGSAARRRARRRRSRPTRAPNASTRPSSAAAIVARVESPCRPGADRDDRLAEGDDHDQREALGEVAGRDAGSRARRTRTGPRSPVASATTHTPPARSPSRNAAAISSAGAGIAVPGQPCGSPGAASMSSFASAKMKMWSQRAGRVGEREHERVVPERLRHGERRDQERAHHGEDQEPLAALLGGDVVRQPRVRRPGPPERAQHEHAAPEPVPGRVLGHQRGHLRDREHEDEVEEQLERRDPLFLGGCHRADERCIKCRTALAETGSVRTRATIAMALCAAVLFPGPRRRSPPAPAVPRSPSSSTGLTSGVSLWGSPPGPDGNLWFTEESHNAVGRITPGAVITEFTRRLPDGQPARDRDRPGRQPLGGHGRAVTARSRSVTKAGEVTEFPVATAGDPNDIAVGPDGNLWYADPRGRT